MDTKLIAVHVIHAGLKSCNSAVLILEKHVECDGNVYTSALPRTVADRIIKAKRYCSCNTEDRPLQYPRSLVGRHELMGGLITSRGRIRQGINSEVPSPASARRGCEVWGSSVGV